MKPLVTPVLAEQRILSLRGVVPAKRCRLVDAAGKILREDIVADHDFPPFDRVMMDGLAVRSSDWGRGCQRFTILGVAPAGAPQANLPQAYGAALEVMTGAILPAGADSILPCEWYELHGSEAVVRPGTESKPGLFVHPRASDHSAGETLLGSGSRIGPVETGVAAACGFDAVHVAESFRITVLGTGNELVPIDRVPAAGQIRRTNTAALSAALRLAGHAPTETGCLRDEREELLCGLSSVLSQNDIVVVTGGVSKGRWDLVPQILDELGAATVLHGVSQKPGKPMGVWQVPGGPVVFGLPGNPVSALVCLHRYVIPSLSHWSGEKVSPPRRRILCGEFYQPPGLTLFLPVLETSCGTVAPAPVANSGDFTGLAGSSGFVEVDESFADGGPTPYFPWLVT